MALSALGSPADLDEVIAKGPADPLCSDLFDAETRNFVAAQKALRVGRTQRVVRP